MKLIYIFTMVIVVNVIRILPATIIRKPITNRYVRSFLYYVPYVTLAVMTFPAIIEATQTPIAGLLALVVGVVAAWCELGLFSVAVVCSVVVMVVEWLIGISL